MVGRAGKDRILFHLKDHQRRQQWEGRGGKDEGPIDSMEFTLELGEQGGRRGREREREKKFQKMEKKVLAPNLPLNLRPQAKR